MAVQPSMVMHWKTVSMAKPMLSKDVIPLFGPSHFSKHVLSSYLQTFAPNGANVSLSALHGVATSPSGLISAVGIVFLLNFKNKDISSYNTHFHSFYHSSERLCHCDYDILVLDFHPYS